MASVCLSKHDINILEKIKDPESNPYAGIVLDSSLPRDPNITDATIYERIVERERDIIRSIQSLETQLKNLGSEEGKDVAVKGYQQSLSAVESMIDEYPNYASTRNNRVQILRRLYGDAMMLSDTRDNSAPLIESPDQAERKKAVVTALSDIEASIALLTPSSPTMPISPQVARTLSMAHTQRAALYLKTARLMLSRSLDIDGTLEESKWERLDFEGAASRDLAFGGRYGNPIAKGLAVSVNPTAKLCGQIVREAMKKEYGPSFGD
ncbi:Tetratricopeptide repeat 36 [Fusarium acutatum]|uniref:Tetratricopeptide repeat 36 n=1 Tax=Fusarium acutatum TaxID=78861 RepID=A0A8H4K3B9_9HYPO|nr:Tetratricopeptide repeat 36 [Fusarium acutatum]